MAFKRTSFSALKSQKKEYFESIYKFSKKVPNFKPGDDIYVIPLGLEGGFFETPCHKVAPHKVDGQTIGYGGSGYAVYIKCDGVDEEGNTKESLCCQLAKKERERTGEDYNSRIISSCSYRVHLPILILGNSTGDLTKKSYPITKVSILNDFRSEAGLRFSYLDMASSSLKNDIVDAYGRKLKEEGKIDYELDENSEEFFDEVRKRLSKTIIKIHGVSKTGFTATMKEFSFFPFDNPTIASGSGEDEKKAVLNYNKHKGIAAKIDEYLQLFNIEVENLIRTYNEKDLLEYYNSALGVDLKTPAPTAKAEEEVVEKVEPIKAEPVKETVEPVKTAPAKAAEPVQEDEYDEEYEDQYANDNRTAPSDEDMNSILNGEVEDPFEGEDPVAEAENTAAETSSSQALDEYEYDAEEDDAFFAE